MSNRISNRLTSGRKARFTYHCTRPTRYERPPEPVDDEDHHLALAEHYAAYWNDLEAAGLEPTDVGMWKVAHELAGGEWVLYHDQRDGFWKVIHAEQAPKVVRHERAAKPLRYEAPRLLVYRCPYCAGLAYQNDPIQGGIFQGYALCSRCGRGFSILGKQPVQRSLSYAARVGILRYAAKRVPKGYIVNKDGRVFRAGMWVNEQDLALATPAPGKDGTPRPGAADGPAAEANRQAAYHQDKRRARGPVDRAKLAEKTSPHAHHVLTDAESRRARRAFAGLHQHHGDLTAHRIEELIHGAHEALQHVHPDDEITRDRLSKRLRGYHEMLHWHDAKQKQRNPWEGGTPEHGGRVYNMPAEAIVADPERFQFKLNVDKQHGVTDELKGVKKWDPELAGVISVWKDSDGKTYVINGHHRLELAKRTGQKNINVMYVDAPNAKVARARGALVNIAEGRGTAVDAAKFMRDTGTTPAAMEAAGISLKGKVSADAVILTHLNDRLFNKVAMGLMPTDQALTIAAQVHDHDLQDLLVNRLEKEESKGRDISPRLLSEMARKVAEAPKIKLGERGGPRGLFDDLEAEDSVFVEECDLQAYIRAELAKDVNDWKAVSSKRRVGKVTAEGTNQLDVEGNKANAQEAAIARGTFDRLVNRSGLISSTIKKHAVEFAKAQTSGERNAIRQQALTDVRDAIDAEESGAAAGAGSQPVSPDAGGNAAGAPGSKEGPGGTGEVPAAAGAADAGRGGIAPDGVKPPRVVHPANSLGIPRHELPQIRANHVQEFLDGLRKDGISVDEKEMRVGDLKPSQNELNVDTMDALDALPPGKLRSPIIVSGDNYVLDGHHRWGNLERKSPDNTIPVRKIGLPIRDLIARAKAFDKAGFMSIDDMGSLAKPTKPVGPTGHAITTKNIHEYAGKVDVSKLAGAKDNIWAAFEKAPDALTVPLSSLISTKDELQDPKFVAGTKQDPRQTAADWMGKAIDGEPGVKKRAPLDVEDNGDGTFTIKDGNASAQAAMLAGWDKIPVRVAKKPESGAKPFFRPEEHALPPVAVNEGVHPDAGYHGILPKATEANHHLQTLLDLGKGIGHKLGYQTITSEKDLDDGLSKPGGLVLIAPVKGEERAAAKVKSDYGGDWTKIGDLARATIAVDKMDDLHNVIDHLRAAGITLARSPKDRLSKPTEDGYGDLMLNMRMPNGIVAEVQLHLKPMLLAKKEAHPLYAAKAEILRKAKDENRMLTPEEATKVNGYTQQMKAIYDKARSGETAAKPGSYHELVASKRHEAASKTESPAKPEPMVSYAKQIADATAAPEKPLAMVPGAKEFIKADPDYQAAVKAYADSPPVETAERRAQMTAAHENALKAFHANPHPAPAAVASPHPAPAMTPYAKQVAEARAKASGTKHPGLMTKRAYEADFKKKFGYSPPAENHIAEIEEAHALGHKIPEPVLLDHPELFETHPEWAKLYPSAAAKAQKKGYLPAEASATPTPAPATPTPAPSSPAATSPAAKPAPAENSDPWFSAGPSQPSRRTPLEVRRAKGTVLTALADAGKKGMTVEELTKAMGADGQHAAEAIKQLEADGMLAKEGDRFQNKDVLKRIAETPSYAEQVARMRAAGVKRPARADHQEEAAKPANTPEIPKAPPTEPGGWAGEPKLQQQVYGKVSVKPEAASKLDEKEAMLHGFVPNVYPFKKNGVEVPAGQGWIQHGGNGWAPFTSAEAAKIVDRNKREGRVPSKPEPVPFSYYEHVARARAEAAKKAGAQPPQAQPAVSAAPARSAEPEADRFRAAGFSPNRFPFRKNGQTVQPGKGWIRKNAQGQWEAFTADEATGHLNRKSEPQQQSYAAQVREKMQAASPAMPATSQA